MEIKYPKGERVWVSFHDRNGSPVFILTSKPARDYYFLYKVLPSGELSKLGRAHSPTELEKKYRVQEIMIGGEDK